MKKENKVLTITQENFNKYLNENLAIENRIIYYINNGHFGLDYAITSYANKVKIIGFSDLKQKKGINITFRVLNVFFAILTFLTHYFYKIDARTTISTILANMENIYLGINKENEFLKFLKIRKIPRHYIKPEFIIRINDNDILSSQDIKCLQLLCSFIKKGKINNTILLITGENIKLLNIKELVHTIDTPNFQLTSKDLELIAKTHELPITYDFEKNIDLIRKFGIQFFLDDYHYFSLLVESEINMNDNFKKIDWLISFMMQEKKLDDISSKDVNRLLQFSSFFQNAFTKLEIINFQDNLLNADNIDIACNLAIIKQKHIENYNIPIFSFNIENFKDYFYEKYFSDLQPMPQYIYEYFRKQLPFNYISALKVLCVDSSFIDIYEQYSLVIICYYYGNETNGFVNCEELLRYTTKDSIPMKVIKIYEEFKHKGNGKFDNNIVILILNILKKNDLSHIASCAVYCFILQILKENFNQFKGINFTEILAEFKSKILKIENNDTYCLYWTLHFKCKYIAFSLEDEYTEMKISRIFLKEIKNIIENESLIDYIKMHNLRGFDRIDLLSYSMGYDHAGEILRNLYQSAEESSMIKEIARINYSAFLIENNNHADAEKLLKKANSSFIFYINLDTYCAYLNNYYIAQYQIKEITLTEYISLLQELVTKNASYSDNQIIVSNLSTARLMEKETADDGEESLINIAKNGNPYSKFLAMHNLLAFYFTKSNKEKFDKIHTEIKVPKLLKSETTFFTEKFSSMSHNIEKITNFNDQVKVSNMPISYKDMYLFSPIERWFE